MTLQLPILDALRLGGSTTSDGFNRLLPDSRPTEDTFYSQYDPLIREEVLDSRLGGSVPCVLRFSLRIFQDKIIKNFRLTLSLNLRFDLRLKGYIPYGMRPNRIFYMVSSSRQHEYY
jgi:hypothetical protein